MPSFVSWLDYSEHERQRMLEVVRLLGDRETVDELGIGAIRDSFADQLFPGTSTIQTRARYFLFVPWMYRRLEQRKTSSSEIAIVARREEIALISYLLQSGENEGVIGRVARNTLKRLPSNIYWLGLKTWGIRLFDGTQGQYHRYLDNHYRLLAAADGDDESASLSGRFNWHPGLPPAPKGFPWTEVDLNLTTEEGAYLRDRIALSVPNTFLSFLVSRPSVSDKTGFPWDHPDVDSLPKDIGRLLEHARLFSISVHGAPALYNLMLSEFANRADLVEEYHTELHQWVGEVESIREELERWDRHKFWELARSSHQRIHPRTRHFVDAWLDMILVSHKDLSRSTSARLLIEKREKALKRNRARIGNTRMIEYWNGAAGMARLTYRWPVVQDVVTDIQSAGEKNASA